MAEIRLDEETIAELDRLGDADESRDDVIERLLVEARRATVRAGAGYWSSGDAATARETLIESKETPRRRG